MLVSGEVVIEHDGVPFARVDTPVRSSERCRRCSGGRPPPRCGPRATPRCGSIDDPLDFLTDQPGAALAVLRTTASRLDGMTQYLVDVKRQFADAGGHLGMVDAILDQLVHHQGPKPRTGSARDPEGDHGD